MVLLFTLAACTSRSPSAVAPNPTIATLEAQVAALSAEVQQLRATAAPGAGALERAPVTEAAVTEDREAEVEPSAESQRRTFPTREPRAPTASDSAPCTIGQIKGNRNSRIYHVPGGGSYAQTRANVACFDTEADAQADGYRRARN